MAGLREAAAARDETSTLREEALRGREAAAQVSATLEQLIAQMREANGKTRLAFPARHLPRTSCSTLERV